MNKRLSAVIAGGAAAAAVMGLITPAQAAGTSSTSGNVFITADWLENQLPASAILHNTQYDFDDYGLTIDAAFALRAAGGHGPAVLAIRNAIIANEGNYTGSAWGDFYAGSAAKAAVLEQVAGSATPTLVTGLSNAVASTAPIAGRIQDTSAYGDFANSFGQAFAAQALTAAGDAKAASATDFLLKQQCSSGGFRLAFNSDKTATDQTCGAGAADIDATSQAILSLLPQKADATVNTAITNAVNYLLGVQNSDGSFTYSAGPSTNSTGLAAYALGRAGSTDAAAKAALWIRDNVVVTPSTECANPALLGEYGAVAKDTAALAAAKTDGIVTNTEDGFRRSSAPALMGLTFLAAASPTTTAKLANPTYVKAGVPTTIAVSGLAAGEDNCFYDQFGGTKVANGKATVVVDKGRETFYLDHFGPQLRAVIGALGQKTFVLALAAATTPPTPGGPSYVIRTSGLAPFEAWSLYYRGAKVASGKASSTGAVKAQFTSIGPNGGQVVFKGQYGDIRNGSLTIR
jgi:hypothetical protein